jgi:putative copper resistance protein D
MAFLAGLVVIAIATQSSVGAYDDVLFWVHMVQHLLLIMVAPPLLVLGRPILLAMHASRGSAHRAIRAAVRSRPARVLTCPPVALALYTAVIVGTHLTGFMNLVLTHPLVHDGEHLLYLAVGYLFFLPAIGTEPIRWRLAYPARLALLAVAMPVDTFTGVVLGLTTREPFPAYAADPRPWGPTLIGDLHLGGAIMWVAGDALMVAMMAVLAVAFVRSGTGGAGVGRWVEAARLSALADHAAAAGLTPGPGRAVTVDDEAHVDAHRDAYNAWLACLDHRPTVDAHAEPAASQTKGKGSL